MSSSLPLNGSIHGLKEYLAYQNLIDFSTMQAFIPVIYITPTIFVMIAILYKYGKARKERVSTLMDPNIFSLIMFYFFFNGLFFIGDYLHLNLPSSGIITKWCAGLEPNRYFTMVLIFAYYSDLALITCPFLVCLIRLIVLLSPRHNERYCRLTMRYFAFPFLFLFPIVLTVPSNFSVIGYCKQMGAPFSMGSIIVYEGDTTEKINFIIHLSFSCTVFTCNIILTAVMFYKLRGATNNGASERTKVLRKKAEYSLTLTIMSSVVPFITNTIVSTSYLFFPHRFYYVLFLRPIGNDYETVMLPWVLFLTHPMFRKKKTSPVNTLFATTPRSHSSLF